MSNGSTYVVRRGFTHVPNQTIYGRHLSLADTEGGEARALSIQALGVLVLLLSRPERGKDGRRLGAGYRALEGRGLGREGLLRALRELGAAGHRYTFKRQGPGGRGIVTDVVLSEVPITADVAEAQWNAMRAEERAEEAARAATAAPEEPTDAATIMAAMAALAERLEAMNAADDQATAGPSDSAPENGATGAADSAPENGATGARQCAGLQEHCQTAHDSNESQGSTHYVRTTGEESNAGAREHQADAGGPQELPSQGGARRRYAATDGPGYAEYRRLRDAAKGRNGDSSVTVPARPHPGHQKGGTPSRAFDSGVGA